MLHVLDMLDTKVTDTLFLVAFPLQQWLFKHGSILYLYIHCLSCIFIFLLHMTAGKLSLLFSWLLTDESVCVSVLFMLLEIVPFLS